ncbi:MAG: rhomboid family intramembrane serine protease [Chloroflexi bacterium]|nr:MAG: rhomboid family intramembrane serine protease [Chloroflexota bacterium]
MLPLRDNIRSKSAPVITWAIIGANTLVFLYEILLASAGLDHFVAVWGLVPARLHLSQLSVLIENPSLLLPLFTAMFLHNGWFHFLSNIWILFIFGDNVEDWMGHWRFLIFYLISGIAANLIHAVFYPFSTVPTIGASGAIAGVLGAYFLVYPAARILTLVPVFIFPILLQIPAIFYLGFWFITQLFSGFMALGLPAGHTTSGVAWWAHIGGFLFGVFISTRYRPRKRQVSPWFPVDERFDVNK